MTIVSLHYALVRIPYYMHAIIIIIIIIIIFFFRYIF